MSLYNLEYLQSVFEKENGVVLNKTGDRKFAIKRSHELTKTYKEREKILSRIKERKCDFDLKNSSGQLFILDLAGTLVEQTFVLNPNSKVLGKGIKETTYMDSTYNERVESIAEKLGELLRSGKETAIVTDYDHGEETWIMQILHDIENALDDDCKNKIHYYAVGYGPESLGKANRNDSLVKWAKDKPQAYMELISQYPGYEITFVDDQPLSNLDKLMEIPEIRDRVNLIILNSPKASIQSPDRGSNSKTWRLFSPIDSTDNIIKYCLIKYVSTPEDLEEAKEMLNDVDPQIIPSMDSDPVCRQFFL